MHNLVEVENSVIGLSQCVKLLHVSRGTVLFHEKCKPVFLTQTPTAGLLEYLTIQ